LAVLELRNISRGESKCQRRRDRRGTRSRAVPAEEWSVYF